MKGWLRRLRGAIGMGVTWALGWAPIGAVAGLALGLTVGAGPGVATIVWVNAVAFGALGLVAGTIFSAVLSLTEGQRSFDELTLPRFALWGGVGGLVLGALASSAGLWGGGFMPGVALVLTGTTTMLGMASAAGTLALARKADSRPRLDADSGGARLGR